MAGNIYDETLDELGGGTPQTGPAPTRTIYDDVLDGQQQASERRMRGAVNTAGGSSPDTVAEARTIALKFGVPVAEVERNLDRYRSRDQAEQPYAQMQQETPATAKALEDPDFAKLAIDDLEPLGALEWLVTAPQRAYQQGNYQLQFGRLRYESMFRPLTKEEQKQMGEAHVGMSEGGALGAGNSWFRKAVTGTAQQIPNLWGASLSAFKYGSVGAAEVGAPAAAVGAIGGYVGAAGLGLEGAKLGFSAGSIYGAGKFTLQIEAGNAYDEYLGFKDEHGQPIDPSVAKAAALTAGIVNAGLEVYGLEKLAESIPGIKQFRGALSRNAVKTALRNPSVRSALFGMMKEYGGTLTAETAVEVGQRAATILAGELGKVASGQSIPLRTPDDVLSDLWQEGTGALQSFALMVAPGPFVGAALNVRNARAASHNVAFFTALGEGVANSKLAQRAPDKLQSVLAEATKNGPIEDLYVPTDQWAAYWQSKGLDPASVAKEVTGSATAFDDAVAGGRDLSIKTAAYAAKIAGTEHNAGLMQDIRLGPDEWTAREAEAFKQAKAEEAVIASPEAQAAGAARQVIYDRLVAKGVPESTASTYADVWTAGIGTLATSFGIDPAALQAQYGPAGGPTVTREGLPAQPATQQAVATGPGAGEAQATPLAPVAAVPPDGDLTGPAVTAGAEAGAETQAAKAETPAATPAATTQATAGELTPAAAALMAENPDLVRRAGEQQAAAAGGVLPSDQQVNAAEGRPAAGEQPSGGGGERGRADTERTAQGAGDVGGAERRRLPSPTDYPLEPFQRADAEQDSQRLTPAVRNELLRIADELDTFPFEPNIWVWDDPLANFDPNFGTAAGGKARIVPGGAGAAVYDDVLDFAPFNKGIQGEVVARMKRGSRGDVLAAVRKTIATGRIANNLAEGAVRVAERREAGDYRFIGRPQLPASWGIEATPEFLTDVSRAIDTEIVVDDMLSDAELSDSTIEGAGGDTSFDPSEFDQGLFDDETADPAVDTLTTGEQQPRLPDVGTVREQDQATPAVAEAPFALTPETSKATKGKQTTLFQGAKPEEMIPGEKNAAGVFAVFRGWQQGAPPDVPSFPLYDIHGGAFHGSTVDETRLASEGIPVPPTPAKPTEYFQGAYHGSPHIFEKFSLHAIGTGEGAQAYGWGLYFASRREVAERYREQLADPTVEIMGQAQPIPQWSPSLSPQPALIRRLSDARAMNPKGTEEEIAARVRANIEFELAGKYTDDASRSKLQSELEILAAAEARGIRTSSGGRTYTVSIPEDDVMLDWDKPASQQPPKVQAALKALGITWETFKPKTPKQFLHWFESEKVSALWKEDISIREALNDAYQMAIHGHAEELTRWQEQHQHYFRTAEQRDHTGENIYQDLQTSIFRDKGYAQTTGSPMFGHAAKLASEALAAHGVVGIKYLDGFSRTEGEGTHNYVVFDDKLVQITEYDQSAQPLTTESLQSWIDDQKQQHGPDLAALEAYVEKSGDIKLDILAVSRGANNAGLGTKVMLDLTRLADQHDARIILTIAPKGYEPIKGGVKTTSVARLKAFYKRFGFVENSGPRHDATIQEGMYREPTLRPTAQPGLTSAITTRKTLLPTQQAAIDELERQLVDRYGEDMSQWPEHLRQMGTYKEDVAAKQYAQEPPSGRRGAIRFGPDRQFDIALFERADLSTFLHETGHFFLEVFGDLAEQIGTRDPATLTAGQKRLQADYAAALSYLGVEKRSDIGVEHHEQWARSFEAYLMEGKAPTIELRSAFARIRSWMLGIYKALVNLNVTLTPEVRGVFDRLLASEQAIQQAEAQRTVEAMFTTPESAGMSPAQFELYRATVAHASQTAREELDAKLMAEVARERQAEWKARRAEIEADITTTVHDLPVYRAMAAMRRGTNPDGSPIVEGLTAEPMTLSKAILVERFGADRLKRLPRGLYSVGGGLDPDVIASRYGFDSGDALLTAVENAEPMRTAIQRETDNAMLREHGSLLLNGEVYDAAKLAVANEDRDLVIRAELKALGQLRRVAGPFIKAGAQAVAASEKERAYERRWLEAEAKLRIAIAEGRKQVEIDALEAEVKSLKAKARGGPSMIRGALPPAGVMRAAALEQIGRTTIGQIKPAPFWSAARRAGLKATEAAARQDFDTAIAAKQQELFNLHLYRAAEAAREEVDASVRWVKSLSTNAARARLGLAGETYQDQVDGILDRYQFAHVSQKALDRRASLRRWVAGQEGEGLPVDLSEDLLEETRRVHYSELTVDELAGIVDGLKAIVHLAQLKNRLLKAADRRALDEVSNGIATHIRTVATGQARAIERDRRPAEERRRMVESWFASHRKLASLLRELDGFQEGGPITSAVMFTLNDAANREATMNHEATVRFGEIVERAFPKSAKRKLYEKLEVPGIRSMSKMERIVTALNWGNDGNRDRIRRGEGWTDEQVRTILDTLDASDLAFVQDVFDFLATFKPAIGEKQMRVYGVEPEWVEAAPITTRHGTIAGGYYPIAADDRLSAGAIKNLDLDAANLAKQAAYVQATTKRGHTKERVASRKVQVRMDFGVMFQHVGQVIHDLSHHEALIDVGRILGHTAVQAAILETQGDEVYRQIRDAVRDVAFGDIPAKDGFERAINHVRIGATIAGIGWNLTTTMLQPLNLTNTIVRIGPAATVRGITRWLRHPTAMGETVRWIAGKSELMANRGRSINREITEVRNGFGVSTSRIGGWVDEVVSTVTADHVTKQGIIDSYFWFIEQAQRVVDVPTWLGQYETSMAAGEPEARAIALADQAVLDSQGSGMTKDLSARQRGGPMMKLWTNFYSYFNVVYNQATESTRRTNYRNSVEIGRLASDYLMLFVVPATLGYAVRAALRPGEDDDDGLLWAIAMENASYLAGTMIGLREISGTLSGYYGYEGPAGARGFAALAKLGQQIQQGELDAAFWRSLNDAAGIILHYPSGQTWRTLTGIAALAEGKTENPGAILQGAPKKKGR